eukprot:3354451-Heterocapsa_arctica.AAC.1
MNSTGSQHGLAVRAHSTGSPNGHHGHRLAAPAHSTDSQRGLKTQAHSTGSHHKHTTLLNSVSNARGTLERVRSLKDIFGRT